MTTPRAMSVSTYEQHARQLLRRTGEISAQSLHDRMMVGVHSIIEAAMKLHFNNTEWVAFGGVVQDTTARVIPSLVDYEGNQEDMEVRMENIFIALHEAKAEIDRLQNMYPWRREVASLQDSRTILGLNDQISTAVSSFFVSSSAVPAKINSQSPGMHQRTPDRTTSGVATSDLRIASGAVVRDRESLNRWLVPNTAVASRQIPSASGSTHDASLARQSAFYTTGISGNNTNIAGNYYGDNYYGVDEEQLGEGKFVQDLSIAYDKTSNSFENGFGRAAVDAVTSHYLFTTIARHIASWHQAFATDVGRVLLRDPTLAWAPLSRQFEALICAPLRRNPARRPIIIVIDALDQGILSESEATLPILFREAVDLPPDLRFFITSRPTKSVEQHLTGKSYVKALSIELDSDENRRDIATFIDAQLRDDRMKSKMENSELDETLVRDLIVMSEGLFVWITSAFLHLRGVSNPTEEIKRLVSTSELQGCPAIDRTMDALCTTLLHACVGDDWRDERFYQNYQHIIGVIVASARPLPLAALQDLHGDRQSLTDLLKQFNGIIVENQDDQDHTVRIAHTSFRGFIMDRAASTSQTCKYHIAGKECIQELANLCLQITELRRTLAAQQVTETNVELATSLCELYFRLCTLGRHKEALTVIRAALHPYWARVVERPMTFDASLANSLDELSIRLTNCGQLEDAAKATEEAAMLRQLLAEDRLALLNGEYEAVLQSLGTVLNKIKLIADATAGMVDTMAQHREPDSAILALLKQMEAFYSDAEDVDCLSGKIQQWEAVLTRALEQTIECGLFFREHTTHGFAKRTVKQDRSNRAEMISKISSVFGQLQDNLKSRMALPTAFLSTQNQDRVDRPIRYDILRALNPAAMNAADRSLCLPGTQQGRLKEIFDWLLTPSDQNVLWLCGAAGLGKSTIATTIATYFGGLHRRGAFLFFDRNSPLESAPSRVITTLAFQLAQQNADIRSALSDAIQKRPELVSDPLVIQFQSLLVESLSAAAQKIEGPIIIVLDALDECGNASSRQNLLELLSKSLSKLPSQFRILITSRPEHDIKGTLDPCKHICAVNLSKANDADIRVYIEHKMRIIYEKRCMTDELSATWYGDEEIQRLVLYAAGLFIWVATAMKLLFIADDPVQWLADLRRHEGPVFTLQDLYEAALLSVREWRPDETTDAYRRILGLIVISQVPLKEETISAHLGFQDGGRACRTALRRLASVIQWSEGQPARTLHKSFPDFLTDPTHKLEPWFIDVHQHNQSLAVSCLRIMNNQLHFNMGNLATSHIRNADIPDLSDRVGIAVPQSLSYPCLFWGYHIRESLSGDSSLLSLISKFFEEKFLFWLEVLSLMGEIRLVPQTMTSITKCIQNPGSDVDAFAQDALAFSRRFGPAMAFSAPHIYISCIPFAPQESVITKQYAPLMKKILGIKSGMDNTWPVLQQAIEHPSEVYAVAFSLDGLRIASGSEDGLVRVWDAETGALIAAPFEGHTASVYSVAFSPDGRWIASGSDDKSVCVWNAETGALIARPFTGHTYSVNSVVFSPDGQRIASGSSDGSIRIWDPQTGSLIAGPFKGHTSAVNTVAFSPDGRRIASGSEDRSVRVCNAETGALVAGPFEGHTAEVCSVAFSPTGKHIASGSADMSVRVWNADTGVLNAAPFKGHTDYIRSVSFSPNGQRIASSSDDGSIRVSDAESGALVAGPFHGHTNWIRSVAFSPDGQRIASGSSDMSVRVWRAEAGVLSATPSDKNPGSISSAVISPDGRHIAAASGRSVRVWDVETGALTAGPFEGHTGDIRSVAFSLDGQRIASGSEDRSVRVWDTQTGALVAGPFEGHTSIVTSVAFSPDGRCIVSGSYDESIRVWDAETGALVAGPFKGHTNLITSVAFSPDRPRIASGSWDESVRVWDTQTGALIAGPFKGHTNWVTSVVFSPDGQRIASGSGNASVRVWDAERGVLVAGPFEGHTNRVNSVSFSPNGQYIASGSDDRSVRVWDTQTGALIRGPEEHTDHVVSVAFSSDGHRLLSASESTMRVDNFTPMISSLRGTTSTTPDVASPHHDAGDGFASDSSFEHGWMRNRKGMADVPHGWRSVLAARAMAAEQGNNSLRLKGWAELMTRGSQVSQEWASRFTVNSVEAISTLAGRHYGQFTVTVKANHQRPGSRWEEDDGIETAA
ncbi:hypothetical protein HWV62_23358 [Athelia sp. TMB]|nr:hypothetical protein HWV62_23358 [Athelia sp. TMB]